jgi:uncharacterized protein (TIGR02453 family)
MSRNGPKCCASGTSAMKSSRGPRRPIHIPLAYHRRMATHFSESGVKFLRDLGKHNEREWFEPRKPIYERELKAPMLALIGEINDALLDFAPEYVRPAQKTMMRIYRDIRFSKDKQPYKTNIAAWWARHGLEKTSGGGFYFHVTATEVHVAAGCYMPEKEQLLAIRRMLLERHGDYRAIVGSKKLVAAMAPFDGLKMARGPKGFPAEHPALDLIMQRQWGVSSRLPVEVALQPGLVKEVVKRFKLAMPLVSLLNEPLVERSKKPLF